MRGKIGFPDGVVLLQPRVKNLVAQSLELFAREYGTAVVKVAYDEFLYGMCPHRAVLYEQELDAVVRCEIVPGDEEARCLVGTYLRTGVHSVARAVAEQVLHPDAHFILKFRI